MNPSAPTTSGQALQQLQSTQASAQDPNSILQAQNEALGVNGAQQTVTGLRGAINNTTKLLQQVAPSVMGRTANSLVTNAQATRQIGNEQAPIQQNLTQEGTDYTNANSDLSTLRGQAQTAANGIYQGQQDKLSYAQNLYNSLYGQEQDAAKAAEQKREFDATTAAQAASAAAAAKRFNLTNGGTGGNTTPPPSASGDTNAKNLSGGKSLTDAATALKALLGTNNPATITNTLKAIEASAKYGNTYDQAKLQLINSQPEFAQYLGNINNATF